MTDFLSTGTITATNGSTTITGSGTNFLVAGVKSGDILFVPESTGWVPYGIAADATTDTGLTIESNYAGTTGAGKTFYIMRRFDEEKSADTYRKLVEYIANLEANAGLLGISTNAVVADNTARAAYDDEAEGYVVLVLDADGGGRSAIYVMGDGGSADWEGPAYLTGSTAAVLAALGVSSITVSTSSPSGGSDGDLWFKVPA